MSTTTQPPHAITTEEIKYLGQRLKSLITVLVFSDAKFSPVSLLASAGSQLDGSSGLTRHNLKQCLRDWRLVGSPFRAAQLLQQSHIVSDDINDFQQGISVNGGIINLQTMKVDVKTVLGRAWMCYAFLPGSIRKAYAGRQHPRGESLPPISHTQPKLNLGRWL